MIVRDFNDLKKTDKHVADARWTSTRMLLADDGMGFSFHITELQAGSEHTFEYGMLSVKKLVDAVNEVAGG